MEVGIVLGEIGLVLAAIGLLIGGISLYQGVRSGIATMKALQESHEYTQVMIEELKHIAEGISVSADSTLKAISASTESTLKAIEADGREARQAIKDAHESIKRELIESELAETSNKQP